MSVLSASPYLMLATVLVSVLLTVPSEAFSPSASILRRVRSSAAVGRLVMTAEPQKQYVLQHSNGAKAVVRTFGCNAYSYVTKDGVEVMGTRADAPDINLDSKPHPGGAPHCFPQFGPGELVQHGFARGMQFLPAEHAKDSAMERMAFKLLPTPETLKVWNHQFEYRVEVTLRADSLEWDMTVHNHGSEPFTITTGMHNYFHVSSLKNAVVSGPFTGATTVDKVTGEQSKAESDEVVVTKPIDMLYQGVKGPLVITDKGKGTKTTISSSGYADSVLWSPYGNEAMGYDTFVCAEPVSASPVSIPANGKVTFHQKVTCEKL